MFICVFRNARNSRRLIAMEVLRLLSVCPSLYTAVNRDPGALFVPCLNTSLYSFIVYFGLLFLLFAMDDFLSEVQLLLCIGRYYFGLSVDP